MYVVPDKNGLDITAGKKYKIIRTITNDLVEILDDVNYKVLATTEGKSVTGITWRLITFKFKRTFKGRDFFNRLNLKEKQKVKRKIKQTLPSYKKYSDHFNKIMNTEYEDFETFILPLLVHISHFEYAIHLTNKYSGKN